MLRAEPKAADPPMMTPWHFQILGWLSGCARVHLCGGCGVISECQTFWDRVSESDEERVRDTFSYYEKHWQRIQEKRESKEEAVLSVSGRLIWCVT